MYASLLRTRGARVGTGLSAPTRGVLSRYISLSSLSYFKETNISAKVVLQEQQQQLQQRQEQHEQQQQHRRQQQRSPLFASDVARKEMLDSIIRVNQAGEFGAQRIYQGQIDALKGTDVESVIQRMQDEEKVHQEVFDRYMTEFRARPTALYPLWNVVGYGLGYATGKMGKEAAMACTVAVETVIGEHYNEQLRDMSDQDIDEPELREHIRQFRDDELGHLETGLEHNAERAPLYDALYHSIKFGTEVAVWMSKRV
eukprot:TRINITY_DN6199_c0_g1_i1.p1 TRINITY_DN6199_c0_g1~~TRINITY_DN6199_c0_g1_i1.p1  ORF type:complete len:256 (-),score=57.16 TRINITY_DN6199_c0_g1_i1:107-874(-)